MLGLGCLPSRQVRKCCQAWHCRALLDINQVCVSGHHDDGKDDGDGHDHDDHDDGLHDGG